MKKQVFLILALAALVAGGAFAQEIQRWGANNERRMLVYPFAETESYTTIKFVGISGGGDPNIVEITDSKNNVKKTTISALNNLKTLQQQNNKMIKIRTSNYQYVAIEAWTSPNKAPGVKRTKFNRFLLIMPSSEFYFTVYPSGTPSAKFEFEKVGSGRMGYDKAFHDKEDLDDFMDYIVGTVTFSKVKAAVDTVKKDFQPYSGKNVCAYNIGCTCKGDIPQHIIYTTTMQKAGVGALVGALPIWTFPAEFGIARQSLQGQAILACSLAYLYGVITTQAHFNSRFKNHCYYLFGSENLPSVEAMNSIRENVLIELGTNILTKIAPRGLSSSVPLAGIVLGAIYESGKTAVEVRALGDKANAYYRRLKG